MKKIPALLLALLMLFPGCGSSDYAPIGELYEGDGYSIVVPDGWYTVEQDGVVLVFAEEGRTRNNLNITTSAKDASFDSIDEARLIDALSPTFEGFQMLSYARVSIDGHPAIRYAFSGALDGEELRQAQIVIDGESETIILSFREYDEDISDFLDEIVESLSVGS